MDQVQREVFGKYLRSLRNAQSLTQREAAARAGVSSPYLAQLEKGQRNPPSREILSRLARTYAADEENVFRAAAYLPEQEARKNAGGIDMERLDWAFNTVCRDPEFALGTRMSKSQITPEVKAWAVELYLKTCNRQLLKDEEIQALKEIIGHAEPTTPGSSGQ